MLHSVGIEPPPPTWPGLIERRDEPDVLGRSLREWRDLTRRELLGHAVDRVIATGHQAGFWHAGILAKYLAMDAAARPARAGAVVEILVDQDVHDLRSIRVPAIDGERVLVASEIPWTHWPEVEEPHPTGVQPPILAEPGAWRLSAGQEFARAETPLQCRAMGRLLVLLRTAPSRAEQFALAAAMLREVRFANRKLPSLGLPIEDELHERRYLVAATSLPSTSLWKQVVARLLHDPRAAWKAYNEAVAKEPDAGVVPLEHRASGGFEMPCWLITPDGQRHRAFEHDLQRGDALILPRALLMTGLVRLALADLFIHGRGGALYDQVTERWFADWLGCGLAPAAMVTATMTLDFDRERTDESALARARWLVHHMPFNIDRFLDDPRPLSERERLLKEIESLPRGSSQRHSLFNQMRAAQNRLARDYPGLLQAAQQNLRLTERRAGESALINDRAWPFTLHPQSAIGELRRAIRSEFGST